VAEGAFQLPNECQIVSHTVTDKDAVNGCFRLLDEHRIMVEPARVASLAAGDSGCDFLYNKKNILVIVCGGLGVTLNQLDCGNMLRN